MNHQNPVENDDGASTSSETSSHEGGVGGGSSIPVARSNETAADAAAHRIVAVGARDAAIMGVSVAATGNGNAGVTVDDSNYGVNNNNAATAANGGIMGFEVTDETARIVQQRFIDFLEQFHEEVDDRSQQTTNDTLDGEDEDSLADDAMDDDDDDENNQRRRRRHRVIYPYKEQASQMAQRHLSIRQSDGGDGREADSTTSAFSNTMFLDFYHVADKDPELAEAIQSDFMRFEPYLRDATQTFVLGLHPELDSNLEGNNTTSGNGGGGANSSLIFFVAVHHLPMVLPVRQCTRTDRIGKLIAISGTATRTSDVRPELLVGSFRCMECGLLSPGIQQQYHYTRPHGCRNPRCKNVSPLKFSLETSSSIFVDWQKLRVQEHSNEIPPGAMPRSIDVIVRNEMVERIKAGDKCLFIGSLIVIPDGSTLAKAGEAPKATSSSIATGGRNGPNDAATGGGGGVRGLKSLGIRELTYRTCFVANCVLPANNYSSNNNNDENKPHNHEESTTTTDDSSNNNGSKMISSLLFQRHSLENHEPTSHEVIMELSPSQRNEIRNMRNNPKLYEDMAKSIAPTTFGHIEVKKGILLMLLGGVHKTTLVDRCSLRGDINVCIVGDPSTAKSQFLKYVHAFLPQRTVYTSGKASSAAGLTAAVQRDADTGEYCIEAGALMLADNGICCIDEFDKMDPTDQVAIHEAMEQQTISITKAGINATLNARASILAAANPNGGGRYDRTKTLRSNITHLSAPILSRFDLFFVILDECNIDADRQVARHILNVHRCIEEAVVTPYTMEQMQRYIRFARTINPKITKRSQQVLIDCYRQLREGDTLSSTGGGGFGGMGRSSGRTAYRITVRQLESMIRLSEALARLNCDEKIQPSYVLEAARLLKTSIIQVETSDVNLVDENDDDDDDDDDDRGDGGETGSTRRHDGGAGNEMMETEDIGETDRLETQYPGEYNIREQHLDHDENISSSKDNIDENGKENNANVAHDEANENDTEGVSPKATRRKKAKKTTKIKYEEYQAMANAIASHLRRLEEEDVDEVGHDNEDGNNDAGPKKQKKRYLTWKEVIKWYMEEIEMINVDNMTDRERYDDTKKKLNLVIRRLVNVDSILVTHGQQPRNKREEQQTILAVHPNYCVP